MSISRENTLGSYISYPRGDDLHKMFEVSNGKSTTKALYAYENGRCDVT
jgi:hypothetical protein